MRKRRSSRATWFPLLGTQFLGNRFVSLQLFDLIPELSNGTPVTQANGSLFANAVTRDYTATAIAGSTQASLRDYVEGQDYVIKRIVGSIFVSVFGHANGPTVSWPRVIVTVGLFVARAEEGSTSLVDLDDVEADPQAVDNIMNPWIWRRSWHLADNQNTSVPDQQGLPATNVNMTGMSGPFIDSKVARRVTKEHRLFIAGSVMGLSSSALTMSGTKNQQPIVNIWTDLRLLGSMRKGRNPSTF